MILSNHLLLRNKDNTKEARVQFSSNKVPKETNVSDQVKLVDRSFVLSTNRQRQRQNMSFNNSSLSSFFFFILSRISHKHGNEIDNFRRKRALSLSLRHKLNIIYSYTFCFLCSHSLSPRRDIQTDCWNWRQIVEMLKWKPATNTPLKRRS